MSRYLYGLDEDGNPRPVRVGTTGALQSRATNTVLLDAVEATGNSSPLAAPDAQSYFFHIEGATTPVGTVQIHAQSPSGEWILVHEQAIPDTTTSEESIIVSLDGRFAAVRAGVSAYTSGEITVSVVAW